MSDQINGQGRQEQRTRMFNPNEHLIQLRSKDGLRDYLPVQWRLVWFREQFPNGTIETEMIHLDPNRETEEEIEVWNEEKQINEKAIKRANGFAIFRAVVKDGKGGVGTGTKSEKAASFPDYIEKAETGAIGRALAALGYGTQFAGDELDERHRIVDSPVKRNAVVSNGNAQKAVTPVRPTAASNNVNGKPSGNSYNAVSVQNDPNAGATEQQLSSIRKLCEHLGKPEPEHAESMSFASAKELIGQLSQEYRQSRSKAS